MGHCHFIGAKGSEMWKIMCISMVMNNSPSYRDGEGFYAGGGIFMGELFMFGNYFTRQ
jgi:hypothetical protein